MDEASGSAKAAAEHKLAELTVDEVEARIAKNDGKTFVYDDNHDDVYASGHVPGAKNLDPDNGKLRRPRCPPTRTRR